MFGRQFPGRLARVQHLWQQIFQFPLKYPAPDMGVKAVEQRGGTGAFTDVRLATVATSCAEVGDRMQRTFVHFGEIAPIALPVVFATGIRPKLRERRLDQGDPEAGALLARRIDAGQDDFRSPPDQPQSTSRSAVRS